MLWAGATVAAVLLALSAAGYYLAQRAEPFLKDQTAAYLRQHFQSELEWRNFHVSLTFGSPLRVLLEKGRGAVLHAQVDGIVLRQGGRRDIAPLVSIHRLSFDVELSDALAQPAHIRRVVLDHLELNIPPAGQRPRFSHEQSTPGPPDISSRPSPTTVPAQAPGPSVLIDRVDADGATLKVLPTDPGKDPLEFDIRQLRLDSAGLGVPMRYTAVLDNAKPPGLIHSQGTFGPWNGDEPGQTPLGGDYIFRDADLSVFKGISGVLSSTGKFSGLLDRIVADGETDTPDFRLASGEKSMPLHTRFHAIVDGTNGNTALEPVEATLNHTSFTARGSVDKKQSQPARSIRLDVVLRDGRVEDLLLLAVQTANPILQGKINLKVRMDLLPVNGELADRLRLDGNFELQDAQFTAPDVQEKIDTLSRRGQGKPGQHQIANVPADFVGQFHLQDGLFALSQFQFGVPGALVDLDGTYTSGSQALDFHGKLQLQAKLSKAVTGWKRVVLTPVDPFFSKDGYGTVLHIKVTGTSSSPVFGLDHR